MYYEFYADIYFLINFVMDFIIIHLTVKLSKQNSSLFRQLSAAVVGAASATLIVIYPIHNILVSTIIYYFIMSAFMTYIGTAPKSFKNFLTNYIMLYLVTFVLGGMFSAIYYYTNIGYYLQKMIKLQILKEMKTLTFICTTIVIYIVIKVLMIIFQQIKENQKQIYEIEVRLKNKTIKGYGLMDTGNSLYEPLSKKPVIVMSYMFFENLLPKEHVEIFKECSIHVMDKQDNNEVLYEYGLKIIPYSSIGKEHGVLIGVTVDSVTILVNNKCRQIKKQIVALSQVPVSADKSYDVILHTDLLEN